MNAEKIDLTKTVSDQKIREIGRNQSDQVISACLNSNTPTETFNQLNIVHNTAISLLAQRALNENAVDRFSFIMKIKEEIEQEMNWLLENRDVKEVEIK